LRRAPTTLWIVVGALIGNHLVTAEDALDDPYALGTVRAFRRGTHQFELDEGGWLEDNLGGRWSVEEQGLRQLDAVPVPPVLERLPGHVALWFGWYGFFPQTEVWLE